MSLTVVLAALLAAPAALAWEGNGPFLFSTGACWDTAGCPMTATSRDWPNSAPYTVFASLRLPPGTYVLQGKLSYWTRTPVPNSTWGNNECFIGLADQSQGDWASAGVIGQESVVGMIAPLHLTRGATVQIGCKLFGAYIDDTGEHPVEVVVWGVRLIAERK
jgi:hypothetical protein